MCVCVCVCSLLWLRNVFKAHGVFLKQHSNKLMPSLRALAKALMSQHTDLAKICDSNQYLLDFFADAPQRAVEIPRLIIRFSFTLMCELAIIVRKHE